MSFFSPKTELALVFDIGSSSVGAGLLRLSPDEPAQVLYFIRETMPYQEKVEPERLFGDMVDVLKRVHGNITKEGASHLTGSGFGHVKARRVFYCFTSPWSATQTKTLSIKRDKPFVFTDNLLNSLMLDEEDKFKKESAGKQGVSSETLSVIERRIIQTRLNGYDVENPFGKAGREMDISYFTGIVPRSVLEKILEVSHAARISKNAKSFTFPLVAYAVARDIFPKENEFVCLRVGGEVTDVFIVEDGLITESASLPRGQNHIVRDLARSLNITKEESFSMVKLYLGGHAEGSLAAKLEPAINHLMDEWVKGLRTVLEKLESGMFLPRNLFLIMDGEVTVLFAGALEREQNSPDILHPPFSVTTIDPQMLKSSVVFGADQKDSPLAVISAFVHHLYQSEKN